VKLFPREEGEQIERIEAALRGLLSHFEEFRGYVMLRTPLYGEIAMPDALADAIRLSWAALDETAPTKEPREEQDAGRRPKCQ